MTNRWPLQYKRIVAQKVTTQKSKNTREGRFCVFVAGARLGLASGAYGAPRKTFPNPPAVFSRIIREIPRGTFEKSLNVARII
jgi:hypothetical protein